MYWPVRPAHLSSSSGDLDEPLRTFIRREEYGHGHRTQAVRAVATGAKSFVEADGKRTAAVPALPGRSLVLNLGQSG
jgi:hypothetical protein